MGALRGRVAIVTGGTRGLGRAIATALASEGAAVIVTGRLAAAARHAADEVTSQTGGLIRGVEWDAAGDRPAEDAQRVVECCLEQFGGVHILVNNAGQIVRRPAIELDSSTWEELLKINLTGPFVMSQSVARRMRATGGAIVNVASILARSSGCEVIGYTTTKAALVQMTRALAVEWAPAGIRVNAIAAGYCTTEMTALLRADATRYSATLARIPMARWAEPEEIAKPVAFLCSDAARYITGSVVSVDGGWGAI